MKIDWVIVEVHSQKFENSCIPSAVEIVLKLLGKVGLDYYELQEVWDNRENGSFADFNEREIHGLKFKWGNGFASSDDLFSAITDELTKNRLVIISLKSKLVNPEDRSENYHMCVIYDESTEQNDFIAFTKIMEKTIHVNNVKQIVKVMEATDILTYTETSDQSDKNMLIPNDP